MCKLKKLSNKKVGKEPPVANNTVEAPVVEAEVVVSKQPLVNGNMHLIPQFRGQE